MFCNPANYLRIRGQLFKVCEHFSNNNNIAVLLSWISILFVLMSVSVLMSPSMFLDDIKLGLGSLLATFCERVAHLVNDIFSLYFMY